MKQSIDSPSLLSAVPGTIPGELSSLIREKYYRLFPFSKLKKGNDTILKTSMTTECKFVYIKRIGRSILLTYKHT